MPQRRRPSSPPDLNATLERLAQRIGDRIGRTLVEALGRAAPVASAPTRAERAGCTRDGCDRPAAAKGLCKSHYNLALYHRKKAGEAPTAAGRRASGRKPARTR